MDPITVGEVLAVLFGLGFGLASITVISKIFEWKKGGMRIREEIDRFAR